MRFTFTSKLYDDEDRTALINAGELAMPCELDVAVEQDGGQWTWVAEDGRGRCWADGAGFISAAVAQQDALDTLRREARGYGMNARLVNDNGQSGDL